jgi:putative addiction module CopG family antidote
MPMQLPPQAEALIEQKVRSGLYASAEEATAAMQLLEEHDRRLLRLRVAIAEGEVGEAIPWTPELMAQLRREAEEMERHGELPNPDVCPEKAGSPRDRFVDDLSSPVW